MNAATKPEQAALETIAPEQHDRQKYIGGDSRRVPLMTVSNVKRLYESGMTINEVAQQVGCTYRALWFFMQRNNIPRRVAAKRNQFGPANSNWKGDEISYKGAHDRVYAERGRPSECHHCGVTDENKRYEWANVSGRHHDPSDYIRLCRSCHCKYDNLLTNLGDYARVPPSHRV